MAFEYGESYYGLRTWSSSAGDVKDASAALTATSSAGAVDWEIAIGATASMTSTASVSCSAEKIILEESDRYTYGSGLWGRNVFAGNANLQTIVSATSSIANVNFIRKRLASATVTVASSVAAIGGSRRDTYAQVIATSTILPLPVTTLRVREGSATSTSSSSTQSNATCTWNTGATVSVTGALQGAAIQFFLQSSSKYAYGSGLYGTQVFDNADLQTIVSATSVGTACIGAKVNLASANSIASSSATTIGEQINQPEGSVTAICSVSVRAEVVFAPSASMTSTSTTAFTTVQRVREDTAAVSSTSGTATIGREKWVLITNDSVTWTQIAA